MSVIVTNHGRERIKERVGLSKKIADKVCEKALQYGIQHKDTTGRLKRFLNSVFLSHGTANNIRIYNRKVFLFHNEILITVIDLPNQFYNAVDKINRRNEAIEDTRDSEGI